MFYQILPDGTEQIMYLSNISLHLPMVVKNIYPDITEEYHWEKFLAAETNYELAYYLHLISEFIAIAEDLEYSDIMERILEDSYYAKYFRTTKLN